MGYDNIPTTIYPEKVPSSFTQAKALLLRQKVFYPGKSSFTYAKGRHFECRASPLSSFTQAKARQTHVIRDAIAIAIYRYVRVSPFLYVKALLPRQKLFYPGKSSFTYAKGRHFECRASPLSSFTQAKALLPRQKLFFLRKRGAF